MKSNITLDNFTEKIKEYNTIDYLNSVIERVNKGEGYTSLLGNHVIFNKYLTGKAEKDRERHIENSMKGIVSFEL